MRHEYEKARRQAENDLEEVNRHLSDDKKRANPWVHDMLIGAREKTMRTLETLDRLDAARPYSDTNIGYGADMRRRRYDRTADDTRDMIHAAMDAVDRILPHLDDRYDDDDVEDRRGRPRRTRRGVGRWTQVRTHVRRMPRRSDMDDYDLDDRYDDDDRYDYDDERYDVDDARRRRMPRRGRSGRFVRGDDDRYDDRADDRTDDARRTVDDARPVMRGDRYNDDRTDDTRRPGPDMRR